MDIKINEERFNKNHKAAKRIHGYSILLLCFCDKHQDEDIVYYILSTIENIHKEADKLCYEFFNIENGLNEKGEEE